MGKYIPVDDYRDIEFKTLLYGWGFRQFQREMDELIRLKAVDVENIVEFRLVGDGDEIDRR